MQYQKNTLSNGIRVLTTNMPQMQSVATTVFINTGSRYESLRTNGISHFLEHMVFKGTKKWPSPSAIAQAIEGIGGQLNAWTDVEHTAYWNIVPQDQNTKGLDVIADMLTAPLLEKGAIEREKGVIIEEINRRFDDPSSYVIELLGEVLWPEHPLGWPIIGQKNVVNGFEAIDFQKYLKSNYGTQGIVISIAGNINQDQTIKAVEQLFGSIPQAQSPNLLKVEEAQTSPQVLVHHKKTDQAHLALGVRGLSYQDKDRFVWQVLNTILGVGMSSRLFLHIREQKGLAYYIRSMTESMKDTGVLAIHAGLNIAKIYDAIAAIREECANLKGTLVNKEELERVKTFTKGVIRLSMDDTDAVSSWFGRQELLMPQTLSAEEVIAMIEKVTPTDIQRVAKRIFQSKNMNLAIIGPLKEDQKFEQLLTI